MAEKEDKTILGMEKGTSGDPASTRCLAAEPVREVETQAFNVQESWCPQPLCMEHPEASLRLLLTR